MARRSSVLGLEEGPEILDSEVLRRHRHEALLQAVGLRLVSFLIYRVLEIAKAIIEVERKRPLEWLKMSYEVALHSFIRPHVTALLFASIWEDTSAKRDRSIFLFYCASSHVRNWCCLKCLCWKVAHRSITQLDQSFQDFDLKCLLPSFFVLFCKPIHYYVPGIAFFECCN